MVFSLFLKASKIFPSILEMLGNLRVIRKSLMKNWESSEVFGLVNSWAVWPLTTTFGVPGVFLAVSRVFRGIMGCSRGVPGLFRGVPGCSGGVPGMFRGVPGVFRGVPGCSGFYRHPFLKEANIRLCSQKPRITLYEKYSLYVKVLILLVINFSNRFSNGSLFTVNWSFWHAFPSNRQRCIPEVSLSLFAHEVWL